MAASNFKACNNPRYLACVFCLSITQSLGPNALSSKKRRRLWGLAPAFKKDIRDYLIIDKHKPSSVGQLYEIRKEMQGITVGVVDLAIHMIVRVGLDSLVKGQLLYLCA